MSGRTTMRQIDLTERDLAAVNTVSRMLKSRYRAYVEYEDLTQEGAIWLLQNYATVNQWRQENEDYIAQGKVIKAIRRAVERYCRTEKAHHEGYEPDDEFFYTIPQCADLLQMYFDPDYMMRGMSDLTERTSGGRPASEGGNLVVMVADVGRAYEALPAHDRDLLREVYEECDPTDVIGRLAYQWGVTYSAANMRVRRVVGRLRKELGGASPWR